jgi:thymidylate synthase
MQLIHASTPDAAWRNAFHLVSPTSEKRIRQTSRAGDTYEVLHVAIEVEDPHQHWVLSRFPAINPAFGIAEVIWILAGSNDAEVINYWFPKMPEYAGTGNTYYGAYGHRLRKQIGIDQLHRACEVLTANPHSRQVVLQYWDGRIDFPSENGTPQAADIPCNVISMLKVRDGKLDWTQIMRSNDVCRGFPYNVLQFTVLQEVIAGWLNLDLGSYCHWSDSMHAYADNIDNFSVNEEILLLKNSDNLRTNIIEGQRIIEQLYRRMKELTKSSMSISDLIQISLGDELPPSYRNLLLVLGAESARRRNYFDEANIIMDACSNPLIFQAWQLWLQRVSAPINTLSR